MPRRDKFNMLTIEIKYTSYVRVQRGARHSVPHQEINFCAVTHFIRESIKDLLDVRPYRTTFYLQDTCSFLGIRHLASYFVMTCHPHFAHDYAENQLPLYLHSVLCRSVSNICSRFHPQIANDRAPNERPLHLHPALCP